MFTIVMDVNKQKYYFLFSISYLYKMFALVIYF